MSTFKGVCIGAGYFSRFHYEAWSRVPDVTITALCDSEEKKAGEVAAQFNIPGIYTDYREMLEREQPDFVDVITPPQSHLDLCTGIVRAGVSNLICQKPLAPDLNEARKIVALGREPGVRLMVHENFRFQPWHREMKKLIGEGVLGDRLFSLNFRLRTGDGWPEDAYLSRQPYFRTMPRLFIHETGIHFIDTFRFLSGDVSRVFAHLRKLNPAIAGEDCALVQMEFQNQAIGLLDGNRFNSMAYPDPRYTFGEFLVEGSGGSARLYPDGNLTIQKLGGKEQPHPYTHRDHGFSGDCVFATQNHFISCLSSGSQFETGVDDYLKNLEVQEAIYQSNQSGQPVDLASESTQP